ncbi:hypothetical protein Tco_1465108 [Tanacetum coccineum]
MALIRDNNRSGVVTPEIRNDVDFEITSQFMKELRRNLFTDTEDEDAHEHVRRVLEIADLFHILGVTHDSIMRMLPNTSWILELLCEKFKKLIYHFTETITLKLLV